MDVTRFLFTLLLALAIEAAFGYPQWLYRLIGHPVSWIGRLIAWLDLLLNRPFVPFALRRALGVLAMLVNVGVAGAAGVLISRELASLNFWLGFGLTALLASSLMATRSLNDHVGAVATALRRGGIDAGRQAVARIVGRNVSTLDQPAVCRAAIESLAENFSDGVTAPAVWFAIAGLPGALIYKAVNTADSMIGHRSDKYLAFGWASARLDDLVNLPASRLTAYALAFAAVAVEGASMTQAFAAIARDARKHKSPNAGWPEAAMAGALGLRLNGPKVYGDNRVDDAWMGNGRPIATPADIDRALQLFRNAVILLWILFGLVALGLLILLG